MSIRVEFSALTNTISHQVHDIEFMQIELTVIEGLKVGNECLKSMHEVRAFPYFVLRNSYLCDNAPSAYASVSTVMRWGKKSALISTTSSI